MSELAWRDVPTGPGWWYEQCPDGSYTITEVEKTVAHELVVWDGPADAEVSVAWIAPNPTSKWLKCSSPDALQKVDAALAFYGGESHYPTGDGSTGPISIIQDKGRTARAALADLRGES